MRFPALSLLILLTVGATAQDRHPVWFPERLAFQPFLASPEEGVLGLQQHLDASPLLLQIGGSPDIVGFPLGNDTLRWGPDFVVLGLSHEFKGVLFKIAAADGIFGMHFTYRVSDHVNLRFRAMHRSAHLVDGNYDTGLRQWNDGREPFNYTRNYGEVHAAYDIGGSATNPPAFRLYGGLSVSIWTRPREIHPLAGLVGLEVHPSDAGWYGAWHCSIAGIPRVAGTNIVQVGYRAGSWTGRGVRVFLSYISGPDVMGAFYNVRRSYATGGAVMDLW
jgi:hypothetical protein